MALQSNQFSTTVNLESMNTTHHYPQIDIFSFNTQNSSSLILQSHQTVLVVKDTQTTYLSITRISLLNMIAIHHTFISLTFI